MVLTVIESNDKKIYNLAETQAISSLILKHKQKSKTARSETGKGSDISVIQNFEFPAASNKIAVSKDSNYIVASGVYGPQLRIYETTQMSMKCMRGMDSEIVDFKILSEDYKKIALVCVDRNIELHAQYGKHFKTRVPKQPRCLYYNDFSSDLLVGCSSDEIYRLNLEDGKFVSSINVKNPGVNCIEFNPYINLTYAACDYGTLEFYDNRELKSVGAMSVEDKEHFTCLKMLNNPYEYMIGGSEGSVKLYDIRHNRPIQETRHPYMLPINSIEIHAKSNKVVTSDSKSIRIYDKSNFNDIFITYESQNNINQTKIFEDSGLLLMAMECPKMGTLFIPSLGVAPKFCEFLENMTEELEEQVSKNILEEFKFVTYEELVALKATHLIGSKKLKSHLHGFTMKAKVYDAIKAQADGFDYETYKKEKIQEAIENKLKDKIYVKQDKIKINDKLYHKMKDKKDKKQKNGDGVLDKRFSKLFNNKDFEINEDTDNYKIRNNPKRVNKKI